MRPRGPQARRPHRDKGSSSLLPLGQLSGSEWLLSISGTRTPVALTHSCLFCYMALEVVPERPPPSSGEMRAPGLVRRLLEVACSSGKAQPSGTFALACPLPERPHLRCAATPLGLRPLGRDMHHGLPPDCRGGNKPLRLVGDRSPVLVGIPGQGGTVCPQNRGEQTQQRPLGLRLGLNPSEVPSVGGGGAGGQLRMSAPAPGVSSGRHSRTPATVHDLWGWEGPCGGPSALPGLSGQIPVHSKVKRKAHPAPPQSAAPSERCVHYNWRNLLGPCPSRQRPHRSRGFPAWRCPSPGLDKTCRDFVFTVTAAHELSPTLNPLGPSASPAPRPPPEPCLPSLRPAGRAQLESGLRAGFAEALPSLGNVHLGSSVFSRQRQLVFCSAE